MRKTALQLVTSPTWPRHLKTLRLSLKERRNALAAAVIKYFGADALPPALPGGLHLWVRLPDGISGEAVIQKAAEQNILVSGGAHWFPAEPPAPYLRLSFAAMEPERVDSAIAVLARIAEELPNSL